MNYLICYDITNQKRLNRVRMYLTSHGLSVQKSFFSCETDKNKLASILTDLKSMIDEKKDKVSCYPICDKCLAKTRSFGVANGFIFPRYYIL